jgi:hypothetical protein
METIKVEILKPEAKEALANLAQLELIKLPENESAAKKKLEFGAMKGLIIHMADDFNEPLEDFKDYM